MVLTDGSGADGRSRVDATRRVITAGGARATLPFGAHTDRAIYEAMLTGNMLLFQTMVRALIEQIRRENYATIVRDPYEGYNPTHDLCALLVDTAAMVVSRQDDRRIRVYEFSLTALSNFQTLPGAARRVLSSRQLALKRSTVERYVELTDEVHAAITREGTRALSEEWLHEIPTTDWGNFRHAKTPYYESYGASRQRAGQYPSVIRHAQHFRPIEIAMSRLAGPQPAPTSCEAVTRPAHP
jgi:hypothetical protein